MKRYIIIGALLISAIGLAWAIPRVEQCRREAPVVAQLDELELTLNQMALLLPIQSVESYNTQWSAKEDHANELRQQLDVVHVGTGDSGKDYWVARGDSALAKRFQSLTERWWQLHLIGYKQAWKAYEEAKAKAAKGY
jgi:hypothetical protein